MPSCAVATCRNYKISSEDNKSLSFHRFPKIPEIRKQWVINCYRKDKFNPDNCKICSAHFQPSDFQNLSNSTKRQLNPTAIPTINLPDSHSHSQTGGASFQMQKSESFKETQRSGSSSSDMILAPFSLDSNTFSNSDFSSTSQSSTISKALDNSFSILHTVSENSLEKLASCTIPEHSQMKSELDQLHQKVLDLEAKTKDMEKLLMNFLILRKI